jgi:hypothetical protein
MCLSESKFRHPPVFLAIRQYFSAIRQYFSAIRQYFSLSVSISPLSASIPRYPPVFLAIRQYFSPSASISRHPPVFLRYPPVLPPKKIPDLMSRMSNLLFIRDFINGFTVKSFDDLYDQLYGIFIVITVKHRCMGMDITRCNRNRQCRYAIMG